MERAYSPVSLSKPRPWQEVSKRKGDIEVSRVCPILLVLFTLLQILWPELSIKAVFSHNLAESVANIIISTFLITSKQPSKEKFQIWKFCGATFSNVWCRLKISSRNFPTLVVGSFSDRPFIFMSIELF